MKRLESYQKLTGLMAVLVFVLFALCLLLVLLTGARSYRATVLRGEELTQRRTVGDYLVTRVRQSENLEITAFGTGDALVSREEIGGRTYLTMVYCHGGWLMELFCAEDSQPSPEEGQRLLELDRLSLRMEGELLRIDMGEETETLLLQLPTKQEVVP